MMNSNGGEEKTLVPAEDSSIALMMVQTNKCKHFLSSSHLEERLNRVGIELWNSPALGKCMRLYLIYKETQSKVLLAWALGSRIVIC